MWCRPLRLLVSWPPRHGKSQLVGHWTPVWFLSQWPDKEVILASYAADFAATFGRLVRDTLLLNTGALHVAPRDDVSAVSRWMLPQGGGMTTAGVGGPILGRGADLLIIDDPFENAESAMSETIRNKVYDWWLSTARTRLEPGASVVIIASRWHEDDLIGRLLRDKAEPWVYVNFPAIAERDEPETGRKEGEALWPERFDLNALAQIRKATTSYWWSAEYMGRPSAESGARYKREWLRYFTESGDGSQKRYFLGVGGQQKTVLAASCRIFAVCDLAVTEKQTADYTVVMVFALTPDSDLLVLDIIRDRMEGPAHIPLLEQVCHNYKPSTIGIEKVAYQSALIQEAIRRGLPVVELKPDRDKLLRSDAAEVKMQQGKVWFKAGASWLDILTAELLSFPVGKHDDQVDCLAYACGEMAMGRMSGQAERARPCRF